MQTLTPLPSQDDLSAPSETKTWSTAARVVTVTIPAVILAVAAIVVAVVLSKPTSEAQTPTPTNTPAPAAEAPDLATQPPSLDARHEPFNGFTAGEYVIWLSVNDADTFRQNCDALHATMRSGATYEAAKDEFVTWWRTGGNWKSLDANEVFDAYVTACA